LIIRILFVILLISYVAIITPFTAYLKNRPVALKLGYLPDANVMKMVSGDQRTLLAEIAIVKVLFYYGSLAEKASGNKIALQPEYYNMFKTLETAIILDPYNMDAYYFAQAAFTWEVGRAADVTRLLEYGMKYRTWDWYLPFYAGFNEAYFLKDYAGAAKHMKKAAELSGDSLFTTLAARYFYESGRSELGIIFLQSMEQGAKDPKIRELYAVRKRALLVVETLNRAVARFRALNNRPPLNLQELVSAGTIAKLPEDPYGGRFYLDEKGSVRSTSKFAFGRDK
jgi:hypothetical protein